MADELSGASLLAALEAAVEAAAEGNDLPEQEAVADHPIVVTMALTGVVREGQTYGELNEALGAARNALYSAGIEFAKRGIGLSGADVHVGAGDTADSALDEVSAVAASVLEGDLLNHEVVGVLTYGAIYEAARLVGDIDSMALPVKISAINTFANVVQMAALLRIAEAAEVMGQNAAMQGLTEIVGSLTQGKTLSVQVPRSAFGFGDSGNVH